MMTVNPGLVGPARASLSAIEQRTSAAGQQEPSQEPMWTDSRQRPPTLSYCSGCSSTQGALLGDAWRRPGGDWGSRGRRFKSGRPDW
jgi:hypothetical protein